MGKTRSIKRVHRDAHFTKHKHDGYSKPVKQSKLKGPTTNARARPRHCFWCDVYLTPYLNDGLPPLPMSRTIDHVIPLSRGGRDTRANRVPCCFECNQRKAAKLPDKQTLRALGLPYMPEHLEDSDIQEPHS